MSISKPKIEPLGLPMAMPTLAFGQDAARPGRRQRAAFGSSDSDLVKALQQSTQSTTNRAGQRLVERHLNVQPTITVRPAGPCG